MTIVHHQTIKKQEQLASLRTMAYNSAGKSTDKSNDYSAHSGGQILNGDTSYNFDEERSSCRDSFNPYEMEDGEGMWNSGNEWLRTSITEFDGYTLESTLQGQQLLTSGLENVSRKNTLNTRKNNLKL